MYIGGNSSYTLENVHNGSEGLGLEIEIQFKFKGIENIKAYVIIQDCV